jgi:hypothetical protein
MWEDGRDDKMWAVQSSGISWERALEGGLKGAQKELYAQGWGKQRREARLLERKVTAG